MIKFIYREANHLADHLANKATIWRLAFTRLGTRIVKSCIGLSTILLGGRKLDDL
ncbi:hypothetical protein LINPERHAP1_LOCUS35046 [Linum perenne]